MVKPQPWSQSRIFQGVPTGPVGKAPCPAWSAGACPHPSTGEQGRSVLLGGWPVREPAPPGQCQAGASLS